MAGSRTLKLSILADVDDLRKKLNTGSQEVEGFGSKLGDFGKKAGAAFAVAGAAAAAYAGKLLVDGVKAAIEDEKAQVALATSLRNVTGATDAQIAATEAYITKTALAVGVSDDQLRPSLDRLVKSTKNVEEAQKLQTLALDIAAGSGKSLDAVSAALAKAYDGNTASLGRLGVGLSAAELKTMNMQEVTAALANTFGGQATIQADTFAGKMDRLKIAFDEGKETVGSFVLDAITPLVTLFVDKVVPIISELATTIGEDLQPVFANLSTFFTEDLLPIIEKWWGYLTETVIPGIKATVTPIITGLFNAFGKISTAIKENEDDLRPFFNLLKAVGTFIATTLAPAIGKILGGAFDLLGSAISGIIGVFAKLVKFVDDFIEGLKKLAALVSSNPLFKGLQNLISNFFSSFISGFRADGGSVSANKAYVVGEKGAEVFVPNTGGTIVPNNAMGGTVNNFNINVTGALDQEGVARQIVDILNNSFYRGTVGAGGLVQA